MQVAIITGASSGIGFGTAVKLAGAGIHVLGVGRDAGKLAELEKAVEVRERIATLAVDVMLDGSASLVDARENAEPAPVEGVCVEQTTATLPSAEDLSIGTSVPATVSFSNGDRIETKAAVVGEILEAGEYTRPTEFVGESGAVSADLGAVESS